MNKRTSLLDYLLHWNEHHIPDVEGQTAAGGHLDDACLLRLTRISKEMLEHGGPELEHLSSCPVCMERWAQLCRSESDKPACREEHSMSRISFGEMDADVQGQSAEMVSTSQCRHFTLRQATSSGTLSISVSTTDPDLEGKTVKLCDRSGRLLFSGEICEGRAAASISDDEMCDLTIWTITVKGE